MMFDYLIEKAEDAAEEDTPIVFDVKLNDDSTISAFEFEKQIDNMIYGYSYTLDYALGFKEEDVKVIILHNFKKYEENKKVEKIVKGSYTISKAVKFIKGLFKF